MAPVKYGISRHGNKIHIINDAAGYVNGCDPVEVSMCGYAARSRGFRSWRELRHINLHPLQQIAICQHCLTSYQKALDETLKTP